MKAETFDNPADFLDALHGKKRSAKRAREARPGIPRAGRAASGEGERLEALGKLARAGWTRTTYDHATGMHYLTHTSGAESPRCATYREMVDRGLEGLK